MSLLEFHLHSPQLDLCRNSGKFCEWPDSVENIFKKLKYAVVVDKSTWHPLFNQYLVSQISDTLVPPIKTYEGKTH